MRIVTRFSTAIAAAALSCTMALSTPASAQSGLAGETEINNGLFVFALANEIRRKCSSIEPRMLRALNFRNQLYSQARGKGYTNDQIDAYIDNKAEQEKMRARGNQYLAQFGASLSDHASLCRVGRDEINKRSQIGRLLRVK